jgi:hypothetical protein
MRFAYFRGGPNNLWQDSGIVSGASFSGNPKKATVSLQYYFPDTDYVVFITGASDERVWTIESRTTSSFTINSNANGSIAGVVMWSAHPVGQQSAGGIPITFEPGNTDGGTPSSVYGGLDELDGGTP